MKMDYENIRFEKGIRDGRWVCVHIKTGERIGLIIEDMKADVPVYFAPEALRVTGDIGLGPKSLGDILDFIKQLIERHSAAAGGEGDKKSYEQI